jgi:hypothetical protein
MFQRNERFVTTPKLETELFGRHTLLNTIEHLLGDGKSVLLVGPAGIGKSALIRAVATPDVMVVDPFERVSAHRSARIRRAMDRGMAAFGAARTLNRADLGQVGRIMWRFTTLRVPPLPTASMRRLIEDACAVQRIPADLITSKWIREVATVARGRPGVGRTIVHHAAAMREERRLPAPAAAYLQAGILEAAARIDMDHASGHYPIVATFEVRR